MTRFARQHRVYFFEEPHCDGSDPWLEIREQQNGVTVVTPHLPSGPFDRPRAEAGLSRMLEDFVSAQLGDDFVLWYYTPMALGFASRLQPQVSVYDCMDELSAFDGADPLLLEREQLLLERVDVVFTGGNSLYESKRSRHPSVHCFPSSVDKEHFHQARHGLADPSDQADIPSPRIGFYGVLDERLDRELLGAVAELRSDWHFVLLGPVVKIRDEDLPKMSNIHYLGQKRYEELPSYLANWDVAMMPFARNRSTEFISPTKTPEYLAGGTPVVSTPIRDVVTPYGDAGLVEIAASPQDFVSAVERCLSQRESQSWREAVDAHLANMSWDATWKRMEMLIKASRANDPKTSNGTQSSEMLATGS